MKSLYVMFSVLIVFIVSLMQRSLTGVHGAP